MTRGERKVRSGSDRLHEVFCFDRIEFLVLKSLRTGGFLKMSHPDKFAELVRRVAPKARTQP